MLKRAKDLSAKATSTKRQGAVGSSRRQEPWCRLISQYATVRIVSHPPFTRSSKLSVIELLWTKTVVEFRFFYALDN